MRKEDQFLEKRGRDFHANLGTEIPRTTRNSYFRNHYAYTFKSNGGGTLYFFIHFKISKKETSKSLTILGL